MTMTMTAALLLFSVTHIVLPIRGCIGFLTGVFGMNVGGLPGIENGQAFNFLMAGMFFVAIIVFIMMKNKKWL